MQANGRIAMSMKAMTTMCLFAILASTASAQVTLEEADEVMGARDKELQAFQDRLNDADPDRALAVLKLLITKGDVEQRRLAIRHGLQSTDTAIRATTLRAILDSEPTLVMKFDPVPEEPSVYYFRTIKANGGVVDEDNSAEVLRKISGYDEKEECWTYTHGVYTPCFARMRGEIVSLNFGDSWGNYALNNQGQLVGQQSVNDNLTNATVDLYE
jgi:hypothetical protein